MIQEKRQFNRTDPIVQGKSTVQRNPGKTNPVKRSDQNENY